MKQLLSRLAEVPERTTSGTVASDAAAVAVLAMLIGIAVWLAASAGALIGAVRAGAGL